MMFQDAFEKLSLEDTATILDRLNPEFEGTQFDPLQATVLALDLPFYPGYRLLDIADYSVTPALRRFVVASDKEATVMDFTNAPIYVLNKSAPIKLNKKNVADYIRFFFMYVRGRHGRFLIVENVDDIAWKEEPPPAARKAVGKMVRPISFKDGAEGDGFQLEATMVFKDSLFRSDITISKDGLVTLSNEELVIEDMPVLDDTFGQ